MPTEPKEIKAAVAMGYHQSRGRRLISVPETAKLMGISSKTVYNEISKKCFPIKAKRFGRRVLFDVRDVEKYIQSI
jgi:excisionase family DNA binding protein